MENTAIVKVIEKSGLSKEKSDILLEKFSKYSAISEEWAKKAREIVVTDESQKDLMLQAREGRLILKGIRVEIEKTRKELKQDSLNEGRAIDGIAAAFTELNEPTEQYLQLQEDFAKIKEQKRLSDLNIFRQELIRPYLNEFENVQNLGAMPENQFNALLAGYKATYEKKVADEKLAEEQRIAQQKADEEAREAQRIENERLKKEAKELEDKFAAAQEKADKERKEAEEKARKEREAFEAKLKEEKRLADEQKAKLQKQLNDEWEERERKEKEAEKELERLKEEAEKLASAGDKEKIKDLLKRLGEFQLPNVKSKKANVIINEATSKIDELIKFISASSAKL